MGLQQSMIHGMSWGMLFYKTRQNIQEGCFLREMHVKCKWKISPTGENKNNSNKVPNLTEVQAILALPWVRIFVVVRLELLDRQFFFLMCYLVYKIYFTYNKK